MQALRTILGAGAAAATLGVLGAAPAMAIDCRGNYQVVQGQLLSTPYCRDLELARVARSYGFRVSDAEVRHNPNRKKDICRAIARDIRVSTACEEVNGTGRRF